MLGMQESENNLLSILINIAFGFVAGLMIFLGIKPVISYGSELADAFIKMTGYGQQMTGFGFASAAPFVVLAPLGGMVLKQLSSVRSIKGFTYFMLAVLAGAAIAFVTQGYFAHLISVGV